MKNTWTCVWLIVSCSVLQADSGEIGLVHSVVFVPVILKGSICGFRMNLFNKHSRLHPGWMWNMSIIKAGNEAIFKMEVLLELLQQDTFLFNLPPSDIMHVYRILISYGNYFFMIMVVPIHFGLLLIINHSTCFTVHPAARD